MPFNTVLTKLRPVEQINHDISLESYKSILRVVDRHKSYFKNLNWFRSSFRMLDMITHMCYDLVESVGSKEHWLWDIARIRNGFLLFSTVLRILQLLIGLEPLVWFRWGFLSKWALQSNTKLKISHVWLQTDFPKSHDILYIWPIGITVDPNYNNFMQYANISKHQDI